MKQIDWIAIEEACANWEDRPDCVPTNVREWEAFQEQYERAVELSFAEVTDLIYNKDLDLDSILGIKNRKRSILECYEDIIGYNLINIDWKDIGNTIMYIKTSVEIKKLEKLDKQIKNVKAYNIFWFLLSVTSFIFSYISNDSVWQLIAILTGIGSCIGGLRSLYKLRKLKNKNK